MYGALWRALPGPVWVRIILLLIMAAVVVFVLFTWVFPLVQELIPVPDVTVDE